jgi:serine/threonine-protein kinase
MPVPLEQFVKQLEDSGIIAGDTLKDFLPPKTTPKDATELARELVRQKKLTKFQVEEVYRGKGNALVLGNYTILDKIGAGGMGQVFKAEHRRMKRIVAVKMLPTTMMKNPAVVARFEREVMAAAKLNHPNIVTAFDADNANDVHLLIMEYVEGSDLAALVKKNGPCSVGQAVNYILQAARGLQAAHVEGIVHRDIKPANLLLDNEGTVKILDMGLARLSADVDADKQAGLTNTGTIMGTVDYMAPEQALDTKTADARADIYSLGCSLFYLLIGKAVYQGDTLMAKLLAHRDQPIPSIQAIRPEVPEEVEMVFNKMVAKNVEDRYQTMSEVIADLERCSTGQAAAFNTQHLFGSTTDEGLADFLKDIPAAPIHSKRSGSPLSKNKKLTLIGGGILGVVLLAGLIISLKTKETESGGKKSIKAKLAPVEDEPELAATKEPLAFETPNFKKWMKAVATLPAEQQVEAVIKKMKELNLFFDGKETHKIENGVVTDFQVWTFVSDISPVQALTGLKSLGFWQTKVSDLSPLKGMPLREIECRDTPVTDLLPLKGMPLVHISFHQTPVSDLSPLKGMRLNFLDCMRTKVSDLSPLKGMPLTVLQCNGTSISDLSPLRGMPLTTLWFQNTQVSDPSLIKDMPLKNLFLDFKPERDTELLRSIKTLETINDKPAAEFWKEVEEQQQGKKP